jgi:hypothetical protein
LKQIETCLQEAGPNLIVLEATGELEGHVATLTPLAQCPELGTLCRRKIAALAGVAIQSSRLLPIASDRPANHLNSFSSPA